MNYQNKYLKYKQKYLSLKNQHRGAKIGDHVYNKKTGEKMGEISGEINKPIGSQWIYNNTNTGNTDYIK